VHFAAGEECGEPGTRSLLDHGFTGDWGITTEPTCLTVATAQRGVGWFRIRIDGRSSHASRPEDGLNPCDALPAVLTALADYADSLKSRRHPLLGFPTCVVSVVHAGVQHNAVADFAELTVDRRLIPGETQATVRAELEAVIERAGCRSAGYGCTLSPLHHPFEPAEVSDSSPFVALLQRARREACGSEAAVTGTAYGSDVRNLILDAGMEAVTFGPGDPRFCHTVDERISLSDLRAAALTMTAVAYELLT
jgi:succinyl-diaminopimelate desuccinylase